MIRLTARTDRIQGGRQTNRHVDRQTNTHADRQIGQTETGPSLKEKSSVGLVPALRKNHLWDRSQP